MALGGVPQLVGVSCTPKGHGFDLWLWHRLRLWFDPGAFRGHTGGN